MSKEVTIIVLGVWVVIVPYLGVPTSWKTVILVLSGLIIAAVGFFLRSEGPSRSSGRHGDHKPFVENSSLNMPDHRMHDQKERINSLN